MSDADCTAFLHLVLPRLDLQWAPLRRVRAQVCKRLKRRISALGLRGFSAYSSYLEANPEEWSVVGACCRVTISRFYRDRQIFTALDERVLPAIAQSAEREQRSAACWSAGCSCGEEPYTVRLLWDLRLDTAVPLAIAATDIDDAALARAHEGCYGARCLRELPKELAVQGFEPMGHSFRLRERFRRDIAFLKHDIRAAPIAGPFDLILCRNLAFTYFRPQLQTRVLENLWSCLRRNGWLVIGAQEHLPQRGPSLEPCGPHIFHKCASSTS